MSQPNWTMYSGFPYSQKTSPTTFLKIESLARMFGNETHVNDENLATKTRPVINNNTNQLELVPCYDHDSGSNKMYEYDSNSHHDSEYLQLTVPDYPPPEVSIYQRIEAFFALYAFHFNNMFAYVTQEFPYQRNIIREVINTFRLRLLDTHWYFLACGYKGLFPHPTIKHSLFKHYLDRLECHPGKPRIWCPAVREECEDQAFDQYGEFCIYNMFDVRQAPGAVIWTLRLIGELLYGHTYYDSTNLEMFRASVLERDMLRCLPQPSINHVFESRY